MLVPTPSLEYGFPQKSKIMKSKLFSVANNFFFQRTHIEPLFIFNILSKSSFDNHDLVRIFCNNGEEKSFSCIKETDSAISVNLLYSSPPPFPVKAIFGDLGVGHTLSKNFVVRWCTDTDR